MGTPLTWSSRLGPIGVQGVAWLLGAFIFFNPIPHTTAVKEILFYASLGAFLCLAAGRVVRPGLRSPFSWLFLLIVLWGLAGLGFALDRGNSLHDLFVHLIKLMVLYLLLVQFFPSRRHVEWLHAVVVLSVTLFCVGGLVYYYVILGHDLTERFGHSLRYSFYEMSANYMGYSTVFAASLALASAPADAAALGVAAMPYPAPAPWSRIYVFTLDEAALRRLEAAARFSVTMRYARAGEKLFTGPWDGQGAIAQFRRSLGLAD